MNFTADAWLGALAILFTGLLAFWSTRQDRARSELVKRQEQDRESLKELLQKMEEHMENTDRAVLDQGNRLILLEANFKHLPTKESNNEAFRELFGKLDSLKDQVSQIKGAEVLASSIVGSIDRLAAGAKIDRRKTPR